MGGSPSKLKIFFGDVGVKSTKLLPDYVIPSKQLLFWALTCWRDVKKNNLGICEIIFKFSQSDKIHEGRGVDL